jgi:hypothetical protein
MLLCSVQLQAEFVQNITVSCVKIEFLLVYISIFPLASTDALLFPNQNQIKKLLARTTRHSILKRYIHS